MHTNNEKIPIIVAVFDGEIEHLPAWGCVVRSRTTSTDVVRFRSHRASMVEAMTPSGEAAENAMVGLVGLFVVVVDVHCRSFGLCCFLCKHEEKGYILCYFLAIVPYDR